MAITTHRILIDAPRETVFETMIGKETYNQWTEPFGPGSTAVTDWKTGSKILFLDGEGSGMVSKVAENRFPEYLGITHVGIVMKGVEDTESADAREWAGSYENYTLSEKDGKTELLVEIGGAEIPEEYKEHFDTAWPKALNLLKELSEAAK